MNASEKRGRGPRILSWLYALLIVAVSIPLWFFGEFLLAVSAMGRAAVQLPPLASSVVLAMKASTAFYTLSTLVLALLAGLRPTWLWPAFFIWLAAGLAKTGGIAFLLSERNPEAIGKTVLVWAVSVSIVAIVCRKRARAA